MTNTSGSGDKVVSENPQSPTPVPPPTSRSPTTPSSGTQVNPTMPGASADGSSSASAGIPTRASASASAGGSSARVAVSVAVASPRKRGSMLAVGEGSSRGGMGAANQTRSVRPNVPLLIAPPPAAPAYPAPPPQPENTCVVCHKDFHSIKALFGHMNSHPNRGWKGAYPPPTFNREEFADLHAQMQQQEEQEVVRNAGDPVVEEVPPERRDVVPDLNVAEPAVGEGYRLPDLNLPPPAEE
ncbi:uncharacterized protein [Nicotiana sylvestris]|uniref:Protein VASP homolog n=2 Tax=Nicotiana TaxID=4085 RepID=A0A1S3YHQ2_TOBAC|nr:PREDICTED: protein VASP homolog [Nicotiana sylvestris]XP_016451786.1 PREDICTED: protein VASP homolog [Nicotiana tabacum]